MKEETRQEISAAYAKDYTDWMVKTGGYAKDMTLRDYFAGLAMQANRARNSQYENWSDLALDAYEMADELLKERSK